MYCNLYVRVSKDICNERSRTYGHSNHLCSPIVEPTTLPPPPHPFCPFDPWFWGSALRPVKSLREMQYESSSPHPPLPPSPQVKASQFWSGSKPVRVFARYYSTCAYTFHLHQVFGALGNSLGCQSKLWSLFLNICVNSLMCEGSNYPWLSHATSNWMPIPLNVNSCWLSL